MGIRKSILIALIGLISLTGWWLTGLSAQETLISEPFEAANSEVVAASRSSHRLYLKINSPAASQCSIPRLAAPLRTVVWQDNQPDEIKVIAEQAHWILQWKRQDAAGQTLVLEFGDVPKLPSELEPIRSQADGSFWLPAHFAATQGEKIRFEPQHYKNTVGFWTGSRDRAAWELIVEQPGKFNVAILQGCGRGQGGSTALLSLLHSGSKEPDVELEFQVEETGHFQDFRWRHLGKISLDEPGHFTLNVQPVHIAKAALVDVRAIHLIRLP